MRRIVRGAAKDLLIRPSEMVSGGGAECLDAVQPALDVVPTGAGQVHQYSQVVLDQHLAAIDQSSRLRLLTRYRVTMSYMKTSTITIRLDDALGRELDQACARSGRTRSELARDALRRQLALLRFERLRKRTLPLAEAQGYLTDEDIFREVS